MWCDLPKVLNAYTKWISVVIPLGPASNPFAEIFLDTLLVVEVLQGSSGTLSSTTSVKARL